MDYVQDSQEPRSQDYTGGRMMPDTHRQLLRTMLQYEIDNWIDPYIKNLIDGKSLYDKYSKDDISTIQYLLDARKYLAGRVEALDE
jgi:hypothetical protein